MTALSTPSGLVFGCLTFGATGGFTDLGVQDEPEARAIVSACLDRGVTAFDTADFYSAGRSEQVLGSAVEGRRDEVTLMTKVGLLPSAEHGLGLSRRRIVQSCEDSLRRLGTDRIDVYIAHVFDPATPLDETLEAFDDLVSAGKVLSTGCSNYAAWQLTKADQVARHAGMTRFAVHQALYNPVVRDIEDEIVPASVDCGIATIVWGILAGGLLSGKYSSVAELGRGLGRSGSVVQPRLPADRSDRVIACIRSIATERGVPAVQVVYNWALAKPWVAAVLIGARTTQQLAESLRALEWALSADEVERLDRAGAVAARYPAWHQASFRPALETDAPE